MEQKELIHLLQMVADGDASVNDALLRLRQEPFEDLGFAKPDLHPGGTPGNRGSDLRRVKDPGADRSDRRRYEKTGAEDRSHHADEPGSCGLCGGTAASSVR